MKTIVNHLRLVLLLGFITIGMTALAQSAPYINKMSITTQLFMEEMAGNLDFNQDTPVPRTTSPGMKPLPRMRRPIVDPDTIDGQAYISATVRITSESDIAQLEREGVIVQCTFDHGLLTAMIPVDRLEQVALLEGVKRINVAAYMRPMTNLARQTTNVDDVITLSQDARDAGLLKKYDGSGVILGIIDDGIDFQHKAFTDVNGNTRIKGAYCYNGSSVTADWTGSGTLPTTDDTSEDHGTHTSSIAGGSSVKVSGTTVTVTDDHSTATYGGMAPGADLFLGGTQLANTAIMNSFQRMNQYATQTGKPLVVSNSWGSTWGARDGYSDMSQVLAQYFGDNHPDRICLFAAGNEAGKANGGVGGGRYVTGTASQASPLGTIIRSESYVESYGYQYYPYILANAWTRATDCTGIGINIYVLSKSTGAIQNTYNYTSTNSGTQNTLTVGGLNMSMYVLFDYADAAPGRHQVMLYLPNYKSTANYVLAIEVYPIGGSSSIIDIYGGDMTYLTGNLTTNGHTWHYGTDDMSTGDEATDPNVISVGSYVTRNGTYSTGDISDFSSYATQGSGATGLMHPWITAPGEVIISGYNHYISSYNHEGTVTVNNSTAPYGEMSGTSMATPAAAGIVALWMEAAQEVGKSMTTSDIKEVMKQTAIRDSWVTSGTHASHFGNGKINALAGIEYILASSSTPTITASPETVTFEAEPNTTSTQTVTVTGRNLTGNITATLNDPSGMYSINPATFGASGGSMTVTYTPTVQGTHNATVTLSSPGADPVTVTISGTAKIKTDATVADATNSNNTLPVYGANHNRVQTNQMLYPASEFTGKGMEGKTIKKLTFYPSNGINFRGGSVTVKLANMPANTTGYTSNNPTRKNADFVTVKTLTMPSTAQTSLTEWVFEDLTNDFTYEGGDLLIEVTTTTGTAGDTYFYGKSFTNSYPGYYSYVRSGRTTSAGQRFLPKVTFEWEATIEPVTSGTVSPDALTFTDVAIGGSRQETVTITNTGNQAFTPVIDTTGLPSAFTVTGNGEVLPDGTLDLTVTYTPTDGGPHSGSFTVTIGGTTYTVTVTGNGIEVNNTLTSNTVEVPAFHTDYSIGATYSKDQVDNDIYRELPANVTNGTVKVLVENDNRILRYDLYHKGGDQQNWTVVARAQHSGNTFVPYDAAGTQQGDAVNVAAGNQAWMTVQDNVAVSTGDLTSYTPVVVGRGVAATTENTYGYRKTMSRAIGSIDGVSVTVQQSGDNEGSTWMASRSQGAAPEVYCVYIPIFDVDARLPISVDGIVYEPYMYRAWAVCDYAHDFVRDSDPMHPALIDNGTLPATNLLDTYDQSDLATGEELGTSAVIGTEFPEDNTSPAYNEKPVTAFAAPAVNPGITYYVRFYYKMVDTRGASSARHAPVVDGEYYIVELQPSENDIQIVTGINELAGDREVVGVTYVNALGMQSSEPFDGINIVVTRYSDGSTTTAKVMK